MPTKKIPSSSGKLERVGPDREEGLGQKWWGRRRMVVIFALVMEVSLAKDRQWMH